MIMTRRRGASAKTDINTSRKDELDKQKEVDKMSLVPARIRQRNKNEPDWNERASDGRSERGCFALQRSTGPRNEAQAVLRLWRDMPIVIAVRSWECGSVRAKCEALGFFRNGRPCRWRSPPLLFRSHTDGLSIIFVTYTKFQGRFSRAIPRSCSRRLSQRFIRAIATKPQPIRLRRQRADRLYLSHLALALSSRSRETITRRRLPRLTRNSRSFLRLRVFVRHITAARDVAKFRRSAHPPRHPSWRRCLPRARAHFKHFHFYIYKQFFVIKQYKHWRQVDCCESVLEKKLKVILEVVTSGGYLCKQTIITKFLYYCLQNTNHNQNNVLEVQVQR